MDISERRASFAVGVNNRGSRSLGPWRVDLSAAVNQLFWGYDQLSARAIQTLENDELTFASLGYDRVIGSGGTHIGINGSYVDADPGAMQNLNLPTDSRSATVFASYPWIRSRAQNLSSRASFSYLNSETDVILPGGLSQRFSEDRIRALRLGTTYDLVDRFRGVSVADIELSQGLKVMGSSRESDPDLSVVGGQPDFTKITLYAARLQSILPKWTVLAAINAQYGANILLSPERYAFGGEQFGRAYDAAELTGDSGAALKGELRYTGTTDTWLRDYTIYAFYEIGQVYRRGVSRSTTGQDSRESAADAGFGVRFSMRKYVTGYLELAQPLTKKVTQEDDKNPRVFVGLQVSF